MKLHLLRLVFGALAMVPSVAVHPAHGAGQATTNYHTDELTLSPSVPGLSVSFQDNDSGVTLRWSGTGEVVVLGYENEPFLRLSAAGLERNEHSPAVYLNQDRYARVTLPPQADAKAAPEWKRVGVPGATHWHDHRTHWMDPSPPLDVRAHPDRATVVFPRWTIPLLVNGDPVTISGRLTWVPPPPKGPWLLVGFGLAAVLGLVVALARRRLTWPVLSMLGTGLALFIADSVSYYVDTTSSAKGRWLYIAWPVAVAAATVVAAVRLRLPRQGVISLSVAGAMLAVAGGYDRLDALTNSQIFGRLPSWFSRASTVACLVIGLVAVGAAVVRIFFPPPTSPQAATPPSTLPTA